MGLTFDQTAEEYQTQRANQSEDVWIKKFKSGITRHRLCQELLGLPTWRQHNIPGFGWTPCSEGRGPCAGCNHPDEKARKRTRMYGCNCVDETGRLVPRAFGQSLWDELQERMTFAGDTSITVRDYAIKRAGTGLDTTYKANALDAYPIPLPTAEEMHDIPAIVLARYEESLRAFGLTEGAEPGDNSGQGQSAAQAAPAAQQQSASTGRITPQYGKPAAAADEAQADAAPEPAPDPDKVADWNITKLRGFLDGENHLKAKVEYPARAQRTTLVGIVEAWLEENPPPAF